MDWDVISKELIRSKKSCDGEELVSEDFIDDALQAKRVRLLKELLRNTYYQGMGCRIWKGCYTDSGYGIATKSRYGYRTAHVASYYLYYYKTNVEHLPGIQILHSCNNRGCINPLHLREGTAKDNADDRKKHLLEITS